ncbi:MAG TPA: dTDP-4-dehydrorhamnose reductase [Bacteroidales bacterium]|nr:dTDP-4-dehydrorhamnose reductase [Bacteroidales bacterium]
MKRILVTGGNGQLGSAFKKIAGEHDQFAWTFIDYPDLDLTDRQAVIYYFTSHKTDYIINCAAFTAVDDAEKRPDDAFKVNARVPETLGILCQEKAMRMIHISTDYIYNGNIFIPHKEDEIPAPESVYGQSKLAGEMALRDNSQALIIRTSWLYSEYGQNFLKTMLRLGRERKEIGVVYDQTGTPTYAGDLATATVSVIRFSEARTFLPGIYNYSNEGVCSWYDFAWEIMKVTDTVCNVRPILTDEYPLPAKRPAYSVLDKARIKNTFGIVIPHWKESLHFVAGILKK